MLQKKLKLGFIGAGFMGQLAHIANYAHIPGCELLALAELRPELGRRVALHYGIPRVYDSHARMLAEAGLDAVVAVTPRSMVFDTAADCLRAGKHLLTEKPMALSHDEASTLAGIAREGGLIYAVGFMRRYDEGIQKAKALLDALVASKEMGRVLYVRAHCFGGYNYCNIDGAISTDEAIPGYVPDREVVLDWIPAPRREDYARFVNVFSHNINLLRFLFGDGFAIDHVNLSRRHAGLVVLDRGEFLCVLEAGHYENHGWSETLDVYFERGHVKIYPPPALLRNVAARVEVYHGGGKNQTVWHEPAWSWSFKRQAEAFVDAALRRAPMLSAGEDCVEDMRIIEAIWRRELEGHAL